MRQRSASLLAAPFCWSRASTSTMTDTPVLATRARFAADRLELVIET